MGIIGGDPESGDIGNPLFRPINNTARPSEVPINQVQRRAPISPHRSLPINNTAVMTVRLEISMPPIIRLGVEIALEVQISLLPNTSRPPGTGEVKLSIFSPGFCLLSGHVRRLSLPLTKEKARFDMKATEEGRHKIRVTVYVDGTYTGSHTRRVKVARDVQTTPPSTSTSSVLQIPEPEQGAVTLEVNYDEANKVFHYQLSGATFQDDEVISKPLQRPLKEAVDALVHRLNERASQMVSSPSSYAASLWLHGLGIDLWREFIPEKLEKKFREHCRNLRKCSDTPKLTILSEGTGHMIPWEAMCREAMYPVDEGEIGSQFLIDQFTVTRWSYEPPLPTKILRFRQVFFVSSDINPLPRAKDEIDALKSILGKGVEIGTLNELLDILKEAKFGLLHFAGHNVFLSSDPTASYIQLEGGDFEPTYLSPFREWFRLLSPLIFMNACRSGGVAPNYTRSVGWADRFLLTGAGAFVGTLWEVSDELAGLFAKHFYLALVSGDSLGEAMKQARAALRKELEDRKELDDPTWLAYTLYGDPEATLSGESTPSMHSAQSEN